MWVVESRCWSDWPLGKTVMEISGCIRKHVQVCSDVFIMWVTLQVFTHMLKRPKYLIQEGSTSAQSPTVWVGLPDIGSLFLIVVPMADIWGKSLHVAVSSIVCFIACGSLFVNLGRFSLNTPTIYLTLVWSVFTSSLCLTLCVKTESFGDLYLVIHCLIKCLHFTSIVTTVLTCTVPLPWLYWWPNHCWNYETYTQTCDCHSLD